MLEQKHFIKIYEYFQWTNSLISILKIFIKPCSFFFITFDKSWVSIKEWSFAQTLISNECYFLIFAHFIDEMVFHFNLKGVYSQVMSQIM